MSEADGGATAAVIEGRVRHRTSNALEMTFHAGPGEPLAVALQSGGDGRAAKVGMLLGFKNGGTGNHRLRYADGRTVGVGTRDGAPSRFTTASGSPLATVHRGVASVAVQPDGRELFWFTEDADEPATPELYRIRIAIPETGEVGWLEVIRRAPIPSASGSWDGLHHVQVEERSRPVPVHGTRLFVTEPITAVQRDVLLASCVDIAIGLRPYVAAMNSTRAQWPSRRAGRAPV